MNTRRYLIEFGAGMAAYAAALVVSLHVLKTNPPPDPLRAALSLLPMVPALAVCRAILRGLRRLDEMQRKIQFEAIALAFLATAVATFSYGFLENVGFPRLSMFAVWPLMATFWVIGVTIGNLRHR